MFLALRVTQEPDAPRLPHISSRPLTEPSDFMSGIDPELRKQLRDVRNFRLFLY